MNKSMNKISLMITCLVFSVSVSAEEYTVGQLDKAFTESVLTIKAGDTVHFRNDDPFSHNVYSLSEIKSFDLGSYPKGESKSVTFDQPGEIEIGCAIHFDMEMKIVVE